MARQTARSTVMKILFLSNLYPSAGEPARGIYNRQLADELASMCALKVVAPLPWVPRIVMPTSWKKVPSRETIGAIDVRHPRYFKTPIFGRALYGYWFYLSLRAYIRKLHDEFPFDAIYVPWAYPDGFGARLVAREQGVPCVIGVLGSDINVNTQYSLRRRLITDALTRCAGVISVSNALKQRMVTIGVPASHITVIPSGINSAVFHRRDKGECRSRLGLAQDKKIVLFVGNLVPIKGIGYLVAAFLRLSSEEQDAVLVIIGNGPLRPALERQAHSLVCQGKAMFVGRQLGRQLHDTIPLWMNACDVFCLPSLNEGLPNVVLEALACGRPVVASRVGGIPEIITSDRLGIMVPPKDPAALAQALKTALSRQWDLPTFKAMSWNESARKVLDVLEAAIRKGKNV